jgi:hypothetical protein
MQNTCSQHRETTVGTWIKCTDERGQTIDANLDNVATLFRDDARHRGTVVAFMGGATDAIIVRETPGGNSEGGQRIKPTRSSENFVQIVEKIVVAALVELQGLVGRPGPLINAEHSHGRRCGRGAGLSAGGVTGAARRATRRKFAPSTPRSAAENAADANLSGARPSRRPCPIAATPAPTAAADPPDDPPFYAHAPKTAARRFRRHVRSCARYPCARTRRNRAA